MPSYCMIGEAIGTRNDFLGIGNGSFGVTHNSHVGFYDLTTKHVHNRDWATVPESTSDGQGTDHFDQHKPVKPEKTLQNFLSNVHKRPHQTVRQLLVVW